MYVLLRFGRVYPCIAALERRVGSYVFFHCAFLRSPGISAAYVDSVFIKLYCTSILFISSDDYDDTTTELARKSDFAKHNKPYLNNKDISSEDVERQSSARDSSAGRRSRTEPSSFSRASRSSFVPAVKIHRTKMSVFTKCVISLRTVCVLFCCSSDVAYHEYEQLIADWMASIY